jgi:hypothetical protein
MELTQLSEEEASGDEADRVQPMLPVEEDTTEVGRAAAARAPASVLAEDLELQSAGVYFAPAPAPPPLPPHDVKFEEAMPSSEDEAAEGTSSSMAKGSSTVALGASSDPVAVDEDVPSSGDEGPDLPAFGESIPAPALSGTSPRRAAAPGMLPQGSGAVFDPIAIDEAAPSSEDEAQQDSPTTDAPLSAVVPPANLLPLVVRSSSGQASTASTSGLEISQQPAAPVLEARGSAVGLPRTPTPPATPSPGASRPGSRAASASLSRPSSAMSGPGGRILHLRAEAPSPLEVHAGLAANDTQQPGADGPLSGTATATMPPTAAATMPPTAGASVTATRTPKSGDGAGKGGGATKGGATQGGAKKGAATKGAATKGAATKGAATKGAATKGAATTAGGEKGGAKAARSPMPGSVAEKRLKENNTEAAEEAAAERAQGALMGQGPHEGGAPAAGVEVLMPRDGERADKTRETSVEDERMLGVEQPGSDAQREQLLNMSLEYDSHEVSDTVSTPGRHSSGKQFPGERPAWAVPQDLDEGVLVPGALPTPGVELSGMGGERQTAASEHGSGWGGAETNDIGDQLALLRRNREGGVEGGGDGPGGGKVTVFSAVMLAEADASVNGYARMGPADATLQLSEKERTDAFLDAVIDMRPWEFKLLDVAGGQLEEFDGGVDGEEVAMAYQMKQRARLYEIQQLKASLEHTEVREYAEELDTVDFGDEAITVGSISKYQLAEQHKRVQEEGERVRREQRRLHRRRQDILARQEQEAMDAVVQQRQDLARRRVMVEEERLAKDRTRARVMRNALRTAQDNMVRALRSRGLALKEQLGVLEVDPHRGHLLPSARQWRLSAAIRTAPCPIKIRIDTCRSLRDKIQRGHYVVVATLLERVAGKPLRFSGPGTDRLTSTRTRPVAHNGRYFDCDLLIDECLFLLCPPDAQLSPSLTLLLEIYQCKSRLTPIDRCVGWA